ncbi:NfrA family protein [Aquabacter cavernae]|uniref:NfrA family protein n=1 Tax=Aquabacter cavernae TaxID=2496029 RepID=UPI0013E029FD|nr:tetratricopeptide repeat protein [Aquabacter cavernae]
MLALALALAPAGPGRAQDVSGPAWTLADDAYKAFAAGDYGQAADKVRAALAINPEVVRWRLLLIDALIAGGRIAEAQAAVRQAQAMDIRDPRLAERETEIADRLKPPPPAPVQPPAQPAAPQLAAPQPAAPQQATPAPAPPAVAPAQPSGPREVDFQAPPPPPGGKAPAPQASASASAPSAAAYAAADAAYKAFAAKNYAAAVTAAREAVAAAPQDEAYRLLLVNALSAAGRFNEAVQAAGDALARVPRKAQLLVQRAYAYQKLGRQALAAQDFAAALREGSLPAAEARNARLSLADAAQAAKDPQRALDALAPLARERSYDVAARRAFALQALERHDDALAAFELGSATARSAGDRATMERGAIGELVALKRKDEAHQRFLTDMSAGVFVSFPPLDVAYLANQVGADQEALAYFDRAKAFGELRGPALLDAAYVAKREVANEEAIAYFKDAIDANRAGTLSLPPQTVFGIKREVADMERSWGVYSSVSYGAVGVMPSTVFAPPPGVGHSIQAGVELYWRPPVIGYRNGALFELFFRAFETLYDENDGATGWDTVQGSVGARWKPLTDQNLVLEISHLFPVGQYARTDWLFRVAYSTGDGSDLRVDVPDWLYWQVYGEGDYFAVNPETIGNFEARLGRSYRLDPISDRIVFTPFLAIGGAYDSVLATPGAMGAGPGANLRFWFREGEYTAPMSYLDLTLQYRWRLAGDARAEGVFASAFVSY